MLCRGVWAALLGFALLGAANVKGATVLGVLGLGLAPLTFVAALEPIGGAFSVLSPFTLPAHLGWLGWLLFLGRSLR